MQSFEWGHLLDWYRVNGRHHLPWRDYTLSDRERVYRVWLSEILLQQTQASRVVGFFDRMMDRFPTIESLAQTDYDMFFPYYSGLGYYSRARNILKTATLVVSDFGGIFPKEKEILIKLPGVGPYTAEAILSFGYDIPVLSWDTNLEKVFARYYKRSRNTKLSQEEKAMIQCDLESFLRGGGGNGGSGVKTIGGGGEKNLETIETATCNLQPSISIRDINNALMDFAALVDLKEKSNIDWENYPLKESVFYKERGANELTLPKVNRSFPTPDAEIRIILHKDHKVYYFPPLHLVPNTLDTPQKGNEASDEIGGHFETGELENLRIGELPNQPTSSPASLLPVHQLTSPPAHQPIPYFTLPPSLVRDTREYVKQYFLEKYNLHISVRPPHEKTFTPDGKPYIVCNAQVQVGVHQFREFKKSK